MPPERSKPVEFASTRPPHPATVAQPKRPHPATVVQPKPFLGGGIARAPHPATVAQPRAAAAVRAPHPATVTARLSPHPATVVQQRAHPAQLAAHGAHPHPATVDRSAFAVQRAKAVESNANEKEAEVDDAAADADTCSVEAYGGNVKPAILAELKAMIAAAKTAGGGKGGGNPAAQATGALLDRIMADKRVPNPGSQGTFGVGAFVLASSVALVTVGSDDFGTKVAEAARDAEAKASVTKDHLGTRDAGVHGEVAIIIEKPGVQAIRTTQDCCLFCYGLVAARGYNHQGLREDVWPQVWQHDYLEFKLTKRAEYLARARDSVKITWKGAVRYYAVSPVDG